MVVLLSSVAHWSFAPSNWCRLLMQAFSPGSIRARKKAKRTNPKVIVTSVRLAANSADFFIQQEGTPHRQNGSDRLR